ncbi:hypothetical protein LMG24238_05010 [Paraburkholderia sediminicola]|uniref:Uncharacterized protein n=1 Tax=Paraburkholderia sediminicola TaxID=458836 RepID=A0A6J5C1Z3_9BURK|nr:hypothetical protein LMG24238_05010 [Paraburkholderia sediminicola]
MGPQPGSGAGHIANPGGGGVEAPTNARSAATRMLTGGAGVWFGCRSTRQALPGYAHSSAIAAFV